MGSSWGTLRSTGWNLVKPDLSEALKFCFAPKVGASTGLECQSRSENTRGQSFGPNFWWRDQTLDAKSSTWRRWEGGFFSCRKSKCMKIWDCWFWCHNIKTNSLKMESWKRKFPSFLNHQLAWLFGKRAFGTREIWKVKCTTLETSWNDVGSADFKSLWY